MSELDENQKMILEYQQTKDRDLLAKIIEKNKGVIKKLANYSWKRDRQVRDLEDCYQEVYLRFIDIVANYYDPTQSKLTTYLYQAIITNYRSAMPKERIIQVPLKYEGEYPIIELCAPLNRGQIDDKKENALMSCVEEGSDIDHATKLHQKTLLGVIWSIAEEFPEHQYVMFYECFARQKSFAEIGRQVGRSRENVRQIVRAMVKKIRNRMRESGFANEFSEHLLCNWDKFAKPGCCAPCPQCQPERSD